MADDENSVFCVLRRPEDLTRRRRRASPLCSLPALPPSLCSNPSIQVCRQAVVSYLATTGHRPRRCSCLCRCCGSTERPDGRGGRNGRLKKWTDDESEVNHSPRLDGQGDVEVERLFQKTLRSLTCVGCF